MSEPTRVRVVVHGRVQGVFFRDTVRRAALDRNVAGSVSNRREGTVEAVLEGAPDAVEALVELCRQGPPGAHVERVEVSEEPPEGATGFVVS
jgi:acylphosphatase